MALRPYRARQYRMAVTEAGLLPFYSGWATTDAWGLNDSYVAHHGLTAEHLDEHPPDLVMVHSNSSPMKPEEGAETIRGWKNMVEVLKTYVARHDYELVAVFGHGPTEGHWYYIRRDLPDARAIRDLIRNTPYDWNGPCVDLAAIQRTTEATTQTTGR